ncbi:MAG: hypothetical protein ACI4XN_07385 [Candidatus Kurthia intestinigallinarum]
MQRTVDIINRICNHPLIAETLDVAELKAGMMLLLDSEAVGEDGLQLILSLIEARLPAMLPIVQRVS